MPNIADESGTVLSTSEEVGARWSRHFEAVHNPKVSITAVFPPAPKKMDDDSHILARPPTFEEVESVIKHLRSRKAAGGDAIAPELLKMGGPHLCRWVHELLLLCWEEEQVPQDWQDAVLVPLFKKKDPKLCDNYRGISLLSVVGKALATILLRRIISVVDSMLMEAQGGFRCGRGTVDQMFALRQAMERARDFYVKLCAAFIDISKAYDSVNREALWQVLPHYGIPLKLVRMVQALYHDPHAAVRTGDQLSPPFDVRCGVRQGCPLSSLLFNIFLDWVIRRALSEHKGGIPMVYKVTKQMDSWSGLQGGKSFTLRDLLYADDMAFLGTDAEVDTGLQLLDTEFTRHGLTISVSKTKILQVSSESRTIMERRKTKTYPTNLEFKCSSCEATFRNKAGLSSHERMHQRPRKAPTASTTEDSSSTEASAPLRCDMCGKEFPLKAMLTGHKKVCTGKPVGTCPICYIPFYTLKDHRLHRCKQAQNTVSEFLCPKCGVTMMMEGALEHLCICEVDRKYCPKCQTHFDKVLRCREHVCTASLPPMQCPGCRMGHTTISQLVKHARSCKEILQSQTSSARDSDIDSSDSTSPLWGDDDMPRRREFLLRGEPLEIVDHFVYLGGAVTKHSLMDVEVDRRIQAANTAFFLLSQCLWRRSEISLATKIKVYKSSVLSVLLYGSETWNLISTDLLRLRACYMRHLRGIMNKTLWHCQNRKLTNEDVLEKCNMPSIAELMRRKRLQWLGHVVRMDEERIPRKVLFSRIAGRTRECPAMRWSELIIGDLREAGCSGDFTKLALNRKQWENIYSAS